MNRIICRKTTRSTMETSGNNILSILMLATWNHHRQRPLRNGAYFFLEAIPYLLLVAFLWTSVSHAAEPKKPGAVTGATRKTKGRRWQAGRNSSVELNVTSSVSAQPNPFTSSVDAAFHTFVDTPLLKQYIELGIRPSRTCPDSVFVRRVFLDLTGSIPTASQVRSFVEERSSGKRTRLIDDLLESDGFNDYFAMLWCDRLRVKSEFPINLWPNAVQAYHRWILTAVRDNKPYDQFVREILTSNGSNFRVPPVNFFRAVQNNDPESLAQATALTFMGCRSDTWLSETQTQMAEFFSDIRYQKTGEWKEEIVYVDLFSMSTDRRPKLLTLPDGTSENVLLHMDARSVFVDWLIHRDNPWFARNAVNRIWHQLFGAGIIQEPDDIRSDNPPVNEELLALLEKEFVESGYDLRHIYRVILSSATYQRSSIPETDTPEAEGLFAHYPLRRLDAETLIDALCSITGTTEQYWSMIPEPFSFMPVENGSVTLADGSITSPFLEKFGRPPRDTGLASERNNEISASQMLHLLNSSHIREKLESLAFDTRSFRQGGPREERRRRDTTNRQSGHSVDDLYYGILSRPPTDEELAAIRDYSQSAEAKGQEVIIDIAWALINSPEFLYKH